MKRKLQDNLKLVQQRIADACARADRDPAGVTLVAVTKYVPFDVIRTMVEAGQQDIGENRVQELTKRAGMMQEWQLRRQRDPSAGPMPRPRWHMIGHLQRNKVKLVLPWVEMIHSVDSLRLAEEIDVQSAKLQRVTPILLEVNASGEGTKQGVAVAATTHLAEQIHSLKHVDVLGLMTMAPLTDDESIVRHTFERTRELFDEIVAERLCGPQFRELSMGMTSDFEIAIEYGATFVRIGTALYEGMDLAPEPAQAE